MTINKVNLSHISNDTARKTTFEERKVSLVKKLDELTTLCSIKACIIIYTVFDSKSLVWPSVDETKKLIMDFQCLSDVDQVKRKVNQETFMRQKLQKLEGKLKMEQKENRLKEMTHIMFQTMIDPAKALSGLTLGDFEELIKVNNQNLVEVKRVMEMRRIENFSFICHPPLQGSTDGMVSPRLMSTNKGGSTLFVTKAVDQVQRDPSP